MRRDELAFPGFIECNRFLIAFNRSDPVTQGFLGKPQSIPGFHVGRVYPERSFKFLSRGDPAILDGEEFAQVEMHLGGLRVVDRKSTRLNSSHPSISYAVFCLKKKKKIIHLKPTELPHSHRCTND